MPNLLYLGVMITQHGWQLRNHNYCNIVEQYLKEILEPLKRIRVGEDGQFDVVTYDWRMPFEVVNVPFRLLEERPVSADSKN